MNKLERVKEINQKAFRGSRNYQDLSRMLVEIEVGCQEILQQIRSLEHENADKAPIIEGLLSDFRFLRDEMGDRVQKALKEAARDL